MITKKEIYELLIEIEKAYRYEISENKGEGLQITIGCDDKMESYGWQSGDNSYTGGAYSYPHWAIVYVYPQSNSRALVNDIFNQWEELILI